MGTCALPAGAVRADEPLANKRCGDDLTWYYSSEDRAEHITGTGDMWDYHCADGDDLPSHPWGQSDLKYSMAFVIEPGVTSIGSGAFCYEWLTDVTISDTVTAIGDLAFGYVTRLDTLTIPAGVTTISPSAFRSCQVKAFYVDEANPAYTAVDGVLFSKDMTTLVQYPCGREGDYTIPETVTAIDGCAFAHTQLTTIHIPAGVTRIGPEAFSGGMLAEITVDDGNPAYTAVDGVLFTKDMTTLVQYPYSRAGEDYTVPETVTAIGTGAFWRTPLRTVTLPAGLTEIGDLAFYDCSKLESAAIPHGVTAIGAQAFELCSALRDASLPASLRTLGDRAFRSCPMADVTLGPVLESIGREALLYARVPEIHIPASLTSLGHRALVADEKITVDPENPVYTADGSGVLYSKDMTRLIQAPKNLAGSYTIPAGVTRVDADAFYGLTKLTHVEIPDSVTELGDYVFAGSGLEAVTLPESITGLPTSCFDSCRSLTEVTLPDSLRTIGDRAFRYFTAPAIRIPEGVTDIGDHAFFCAKLTALTLPDSVARIGDYAFDGCRELKTVTFGKNLTQLGQYAFGFCDVLGRAIFTGDAPEAVYRPFYECAVGFAVYYTQGTQGWKPVMWKSCRSVPLGRFPDFDDVPADKYYYNSVSWAVQVGVAGGKDEAHFDPDGTCTRAQAVTFLWRANGAPVVDGRHPFLDVPEDAYYRQAVIWAVENGITTGVDDTHFDPNAPVTRAQFVTFLHRAKGEPIEYGTPAFKDVPRYSYYFRAVRWAEVWRVVSGTSKTTFSPNASCTRAQAVTFLLRAYGGSLLTVE